MESLGLGEVPIGVDIPTQGRPRTRLASRRRRSTTSLSTAGSASGPRTAAASRGRGRRAAERLPRGAATCQGSGAAAAIGSGRRGRAARPATSSPLAGSAGALGGSRRGRRVTLWPLRRARRYRAGRWRPAPPALRAPIPGPRAAWLRWRVGGAGTPRGRTAAESASSRPLGAVTGPSSTPAPLLPDSHTPELRPGTS